MSDRLNRLLSSRDILAQAVAECESARDLAALSREYRAVLAEIEQLAPAESKGDDIDEIAQRRAARRSSPAANPPRARRSS